MAEPGSIVFRGTAKIIAEIEDDGSPEKERFWGARQKIARARKLTSEFKSIVTQHFEAFPPDVKFEFTQAGGPSTGNILVHAKARRVPVEAGVIVGDIVHNLRAALDLMATDLVDVVGQSTKGVMFPFGKSEQHFLEQMHQKKFDRAGDAAVTLIKKVAPYTGGNDALRAIHDLDIQDKHVALQPVTTIAVGGIKVSPGRNAAEAFSISAVETPVRVVFPDAGALAGEDVVPALERAANLVESVVDEFAALVSSTAP
jgi:hypothetical protein